MTNFHNTRMTSDLTTHSTKQSTNCFLCKRIFKKNESTKRLAGHSKNARVCKKCTEEWRVKVVA